MAKAPKAPGSNGPGSATQIIDEFTTRASDPGVSDGYWSCHVMARALGPIARLSGEAPARALLPRLSLMPTIVPEALGLIAAGLAARGERDGAVTALAEAEALIVSAAIDGEAGTVAWSAIARALHALGDDAGVERALDEAHACARRDRANPTQPWPHLALAFADTGRTERGIALFRSLGENDIAFDTERAAERVIASALAAGDLASLEALHKILAENKLYTFVAGLRQGADAAMRAGHGEVFARVLTLMKGQSYVSGVGAALSLAAAESNAALARALAELTRDQEQFHEALLADAFAALGDDAEAERILASLPPERRDPRSDAETLGRVLRLLRARSVGVFQKHVDACLARASALEPRDACVATGELGLALIAAGDAAQGSPLLDASVAAADALPKSNQGWGRNHAIEMLGRRLAELGQWSAALAALKKCTAKHAKVQIVSRLANAYARAQDPAGAVMVLGYAPKGTLKGLMSACDALYSLTGAAPPYLNYA